MERLNIYDVMDKEFIESGDSESGKSDFDDAYYSCKPPLSEDYLHRDIKVVEPNQFSENWKNVSIDNYYGKILLDDIFDCPDNKVMQFRPNKLTGEAPIWPIEFIKFVESNAKMPLRKREVHDSKIDNSPALFRATTSLQEEAEKESNQQKVFEAKEQQNKLFFVGFILLIICILCIMFVFIHNQSFWLHSKINLIKCGFLCPLKELQ